jgi:RNA polymerase sigma-70 factor (ECF subfamily)
VRRQGQSPADAEDLVQEFFARLLAKDYLAVVDREKGRFRTFLVMAMKRFLANEWDRLRTQKRGGGQAALPLDAAQAEIRYQEDASLSRTAHMTFDREWAVTLLHQTLNRLRQEHERLGSGQDFEVISRFLTVGKESIPYGQTAVQLGISEAAARMAVHRLRRRFREVVREEVAQTVARAEEVDEEIRYLIEILSQ